MLEIVGVVELENENPALAIRFPVDQARVRFGRFIYFGDRSFHRRVNVAGGFHGFDNRDRFLGVRLPIYLR